MELNTQKRLTSRMVELYEYQAKVAAQIRGAIESGKNVCLEMPTGTGKTLTVLAALRGIKFSVFTRTLSQYSAWERDCISLGYRFSGLYGKARVCKFLTKEPKDLRRKTRVSVRGKKWFADGFPDLPLKRVGRPHEQLEETDLSPEEWESVASELREAVRSSLAKCPECDFNKFDRRKPFPFIRSVYDYAKGEKDWCGYFAAREADTQVKLYSYPIFFLLRHLTKNKSVLVFDEAHNLEDAGDWARYVIDTDYLSRVHRLCGKEEWDSLNNLKVWRNRLSGSGIPDEPPSLVVTEGCPREEELAKLSGLLKIIRTAPERFRYRITDKDVEIKCVDPSLPLEPLKSYRWIMMSGTMPSDWYLKKVLGLDDYVRVVSYPWSQKIRYFRHYSGSMKYELRTQEKEKIMKDVFANFSADGELKLLVVPSYEIAEWFSGRYFIETPQMKISEVPLSGTVVGVMRGKIVEGVEFVDEAGRSRIKKVGIVAVPFGNSADYFFRETLATIAKKVGKGGEWSFMRERAINAVSQVIGRGIRHRDDRLEVHLFDKRFSLIADRLPSAVKGSDTARGIQSGDSKSFLHAS